jgi:phosphate transport system protein
MSKHLQRDLENVQREILALSAMVEETIDKASRSLCERRADLAAEVLRGDDEIDRREVRIEEECLKMLALHQPVAVDLRRIAMVIKINSDLERIADLAHNIAERAEFLATQPTFPIPAKLNRMVELATMMVRTAIDVFVNLNPRAARRVCALDEQVDQLNREIIEELYELMRSQPDMVAAAMHCFSAARHVERIADHATNIAEDVIYLVEGEIARHRHDGVHLPV